MFAGLLSRFASFVLGEARQVGVGVFSLDGEPSGVAVVLSFQRGIMLAAEITPEAAEGVRAMLARTIADVTT